MRFPLAIAAVCFIAWGVPQNTFGYPAVQEKTDGPQATVEMLTTNISVVDDEGLPIVGASVVTQGPLGDDFPHWIGWPERFGPPAVSTTNEKGVAQVRYPKFGFADFPTTRLRLIIDHKGFVKKNEIQPFNGTVQLESGMRIIVSAIDAKTRKKIESDVYVALSGGETDYWKPKLGMLSSPVYSKVQRQLRLVKITAGEPTLFSDNIVLEPKTRHMIRNVELAIGTRVEGKVSDDVPRPIVNGHIASYVVRLFNNKDDGTLERKWAWGEQVKINADGTFVFPSLPRGEVLQMVAVCDGYVSSQPERESVQEFFPNKVNSLDRGRVIPHLVLLEGDVVKPEIRMEKTTSVRFKVQTEDGKPTPDILLEMWPNQEYLTYGTTVIGGGVSTAKRLVARRDNPLLKSTNNFADWVNPYEMRTGQNGIAVIKGLPAGRELSFKIGNDEYELPVTGDNKHYNSINTQHDEVTETTITIKRRSTKATKK